MNKGEFIDRLAGRANLTKKEARGMVDSMLGLIEETLLEGEELKLVGFGKRFALARPAVASIPRPRNPSRSAPRSSRCSSRAKN